MERNFSTWDDKDTNTKTRSDKEVDGPALHRIWKNLVRTPSSIGQRSTAFCPNLVYIRNHAFLSHRGTLSTGHDSHSRWELVLPELKSWGGEYEKLVLGWNELVRCGMRKTSVLRFARGRDRTSNTTRSVNEFGAPEKHRILYISC